MAKIFITGDTHIPIDIDKLSSHEFTEQKSLTKDDYVIICGDFGGVWAENSKEDLYWQKWLNNKNFTTLFVDGNHENFDLLNAYPVTEWNGGKVHFIQDSIIHLMRGQVFNINGYKFFTMGGGKSIDEFQRTPGRSWWEAEQPSVLELTEGKNNLAIHNYKVDYVITHTTSIIMMHELCYLKEDTSLNEFFDSLEEKLEYKHWFFGHFHEDLNVDDKHTIVYNNIIRLI
jgi:predicted phosphodiesterase